MLTLTEPGSARFTAEWMVSIPSFRKCIEVAHVSFEFVMICDCVFRSYHALLRMPWCPGWQPVRIAVWFANVTVGSDAIAPCRNDVRIAMRRATFGASPRAAMSYRTFGL